MSDELIRKTDVLDLLNDLINDFGDNYELYSTLFDSVDEAEAVDAEEPPNRRSDYYRFVDIERRGSQSEY